MRPCARFFLEFSLILTLIGLAAVGNISGQSSDGSKIFYTEVPNTFSETKFKIKGNIPDSLTAANELNRLISIIRMDGFLAASVDSFFVKENELTAWVHIGNYYKWIMLSTLSVDEFFLRKAGLDRSNTEGQRILTRQLGKYQEKLLKTAENNGYPFASVFLDDLGVIDDGISARLILDKNQQIFIDSIAIEGESGTSDKFIRNYIGIQPKEAYNESAVVNIRKRLNELNFITMEQDPEVVFSADKALIKLEANSRPASRFDFLLGILPGRQGEKVQISGEAKLHLINPWGGGRELILDWERLRLRTQRFNVGIKYPYILQLPLGLNADLDIYKQDSLYLDIKGGGAVQYTFSGNHFIEAFYRQHNTNVLEIDTAEINRTNMLPDVLDMKSFSYNISHHYHSFDNYYNPLKGFSWTISIGAGSKKIEQNNQISSLFEDDSNSMGSNLYNEIDLKSTIYKAGIQFEKFWKLGTRSTLKSWIISEALFSRDILENEKFRIGGNKKLRGFNEESIFTPYYSILTLEYRYLLAPRSYFYAFIDGAAIEGTSEAEPGVRYPFGFGSGIALETKAGIFGINYALGKVPGESFQVRSGKIHFGYVNYF